MRVTGWRGILLLCGLLGLLASAAAEETFPALRALQAQGGAVSALAVDLASGRTLARLNPDRRLTPASLTKLFTTAAALEAWGPAKTFSTRLLATRAPHGDVVPGDLMLLGGGDPGLTHAQLWTLAMQLKSAGIDRVSGRLVVNQSLFGAVACMTDDRCKAAKQSDSVYDAPLSAVGVDFASWCVVVTPGPRVGTQAQVQPCALTLPAVDLRGRVMTTARNRPTWLEVARVTVDGRDQLTVSGRIALASPARRVYCSASRAAWQTGVIMRQLLAQAGVSIQGPTAVTSNPPPAGARALATVESAPLRQQLMTMMAYSNNYMADTLALDLLAEHPSQPHPLTLAAAGAAVQALAQRLSDPAPDDVAGKPSLFSGSGLTPDNAVSAADIVALLAGVYHRTDLFPAYLGALSVPRYAVLNILKGGSPDWSTRLAAKTGLLNDPVSVLGVAGYFRKHDGGWGAFAIVVNGTRHHPHIPYDRSIGAIHHDVAQLLSRH